MNQRESPTLLEVRTILSRQCHIPYFHRAFLESVGL